MNINYIILAHKHPEQLKRLVLKLLEPWTFFYIHIDSNTPIEPFKDALKDIPRIFFLEGKDRERGTWGDIGIVKGTLNAMEKITEANGTGYSILLSGQDYPLKSNNFIREFFEKNRPTCYISLFTLPHPQWDAGGLDRIEKYKINKSVKRGHFLQLPSVYEKDFYTSKTAGKLNFLRKSHRYSEIKLVLKKRDFPHYLEAYGGGQWWAFPMKVVQRILHFTKNHPDYLEYHRYTLLPDEIFFHSIIATELATKNGVRVSPSVTYVNWERSSGPLPVTFTENDLEELRQAAKEKLFARKFDCELDKKILDQIDKQLIKNSS